MGKGGGCKEEKQNERGEDWDEETMGKRKEMVEEWKGERRGIYGKGWKVQVREAKLGMNEGKKRGEPEGEGERSAKGIK